MIKCNLSVLMGKNREKISEVARATGISRTTLTSLYYERGKAVTFDVLDRLCRHFECGVGDLFIKE